MFGCFLSIHLDSVNDMAPGGGTVMFLKVGKDSENISVWLYVYYMAANTRMIQSRPNYLGRARLREMLIPNMVMPNCSYIKIELLLGW